jgi:beta-glucanase (GH16 family)
MRRFGLLPGRLAAAVCLVSAFTISACTNSTPSPPDSTPSPPRITADGQAGWAQAWAADFAGSADKGVDTGVWDYGIGQGVFGGTEIETMTSSTQNVHLDGHGGLDITAVRDGSSWTSGRIHTKSTFAPPAGGEMMVTASILQPGPANALGYWPAFWMLGPGSWPEHGEIDILEDANGLSDHSGTFSCGPREQGPCDQPDGLGTGLLPCPGCQSSYHVYSVVIDRRNPSHEQIRWYLNNHEFFSVSERSIGAGPWTEAVDHGFVIILDLAIGGQYPEGKCGCTAPNDQTTSGGTMSVRDLAVYDR